MVSMMFGCEECKIGHKARLFILINGVCLYLVFGALVFSQLEEKNEQEQVDRLRLIRNIFAQKINGCITDNELEGFIREVVQASEAGILATNNVTFVSSWSFGQAFFFVGTLVTTIGYGHTLPLSYSGKIFAIFYSMAGIPLTFIMFSAVVSRLMGPLASFLHLLKAKLVSLKDLHIRMLHLLIVALILSIVFFFIPSGIFSGIESQWNYLDSFYYCFISLTTIGLGDYIPGEKVEDPTLRAIYKIAVTLYLFLGMIFIMTTVAVLCNIQELDLSRYFILDPDESANKYGNMENERITPGTSQTLPNYTKEKKLNRTSSESDNSENGYRNHAESTP